jgi:hypothetical protein
MGLVKDLIIWLSGFLLRSKMRDVQKAIESDPELKKELEKARKANQSLKKDLEEFCKRQPDHPLCADSWEEMERRARERDAKNPFLNGKYKVKKYKWMK